MYIRFRPIYLFLCLSLLLVSMPFPVTASVVGYVKQKKVKEEKRVYKIAGEQHLAPFSFINETGEFTGFSVALFDNIAKNEKVEFEYIPMDLYQATEALQKGEVDAIMGMKYSAEQSERFAFSESYFTMADAVIVPNELASEVNKLTDLREKTIVMQEEPVSFDLLLNVRRVDFLLALNPEDALQFLFMGRADAYLSNKWTAEYYLRQAGKQSEYEVLDHLSVPSEFAVAVRPGETELLSFINRSLNRMEASGEYQQLYNEWFTSSTDERLKELKNWIVFLILMITLSFAVLYMTYIWNKRLQKEVEKRTSALAIANEKLEVQRRAISDANAFKTQIINHMYYGILTFDQSFQLTSINQRAIQMLRLSERVSVQTADVLEQPLIRRILHTYEQTWDNKIKLLKEEIEIEQEGQTQFFLYRLIPLYKEGGQMNGYLLTLADRSEAKMLEEKLATQEKMRALGQLVAGVAHEIRNPLTSMKMFIDLLPRKYEDPVFREELLKHVPEALHRMNRIVETLLDYARPKYPKKKMFAVDSFFHSLEAIIQPTLRKKGVQLDLKIESGMMLYSDPDQMKQVMLNLMLNAVDAMEERSEKILFIESKTDQGIGIIRVSDTGCGMGKEEVSHILEPFYTTKEHGVGLGLTLCYQWVKENNGEMNIESVKGQGTTFFLELPMEEKGRGH
ncbi:transporter substrate-binding domain-containing protein [Bacillus sp. REN10]|uniref:transporter substrate-binding domain-containing protein n=1 Tax=Bacillus sp. REN10 TaxID=2782541 RepID=UPI00193B552F|nr:transporter substrate-binding domain-containing protein [Bacillus sp. REN10]